MGYALFVTFDRSISDVEAWNMCGKVLAQNIEQLDNVARHLRVTSLSEMICVSQEYLEELLDEAIETDVEEQWFTPSEGLATVDRMINFVQNHPEQFEQAAQLQEDLGQLRQYLNVANQHQAMFHLTPEI